MDFSRVPSVLTHSLDSLSKPVEASKWPRARDCSLASEHVLTGSRSRSSARSGTGGCTGLAPVQRVDISDDPDDLPAEPLPAPLPVSLPPSSRPPPASPDTALMRATLPPAMGRPRRGGRPRASASGVSGAHVAPRRARCVADAGGTGIGVTWLGWLAANRAACQSGTWGGGPSKGPMRRCNEGERSGREGRGGTEVLSPASLWSKCSPTGRV